VPRISDSRGREAAAAFDDADACFVEFGKLKRMIGAGKKGTLVMLVPPKPGAATAPQNDDEMDL